MRRKLLLIFFFTSLFLLLCGYFLFQHFLPANQKTKLKGSTGVIHEVILKEEAFSPKELTVNTGDTVKFSTELGQPFWPASDLHPTHGIYPEFDPQQPIESDKTWTFTFFKKGLWKFHDHLNPYYRGTITVI